MTVQTFHSPNLLKSLPGYQVAYETYGQLNLEKSNAVLLCHALTGDSHVASHHEDDTPGWWDAMVGPGKAFDTTKYFVICSNVLGGCKGSTGPGSDNPETGQPYGLSFPMITTADMVTAQAALLDALGIERLLAVAGGSLGGFQALEWAIRFPQRVRRVLGVATAARVSPQAIAFNAVGRHAIMNDPSWNNGDYYPGEGPVVGLSTARMIGHITYLSEASLERKFGRRLQDKDQPAYDFSTEFQIESYLNYQGQRFTQRFDANSYLYLTKAMDYFDLAADYGSLAQAFQSVEASSLIVSYSSDWLFPPEAGLTIARGLRQAGKAVSYVELESSAGHDAFLVDTAALAAIIPPFLAGGLVNG